MKEDFPLLWLPTRKTKGRDVPLSLFLASGPWREVFNGMIEECSSEHWFKMDCWMDGDGLRSLLFGLPLPLVGVDELS